MRADQGQTRRLRTVLGLNTRVTIVWVLLGIRPLDQEWLTSEKDLSGRRAFKRYRVADAKCGDVCIEDVGVLAQVIMFRFVKRDAGCVVRHDVAQTGGDPFHQISQVES